MSAGVQAANHPQTSLTAVSPLVQSIGQWGTTGRGGAEVMPRPFNVFDAGAFGPGTPLWPMTIDVPNPETGEVEPRRLQYPVFWNLPVGVPGSEGLGTYASFAQLREYADTYNIARRCIEARKKEMLGLEWNIVPTPEAAEAMKGSIVAKADWEKRKSLVMGYLSRPDRSPDSPSTNWGEWFEMIEEDRLVTDAVSIYIHPPLGGATSGWMDSNIGSLDYVDGTTIRPLFDLRGGTPPPSTPAFQQFLWGVPRTDYASMAEGRDLDELPEYVGAFKYREMRYIRNVRRGWTPYGLSPIEQALLPIQIGLARQNTQLQFYSEGTQPYAWVIPGAELISSPQQVRQLQNALNAVAGDTAWKQKLVVLPPGSKTEAMKPYELSDEFDLFLVSLVTAMFGMSPQDLGFVPNISGTLSSMGNKALASANSQNSLDHWLEPETAAWTAEFNYFIQKVMRQTDMAWKWTGLDAPEDLSQIAQDATMKLKASLITIDEGREELGLDPFEEPWSQVPLLFSGDQASPVSTAVESAIWEFKQAQLQPQTLAEAPWVPIPPAGGGAGGAPSGGSSGGSSDSGGRSELTTVSHEAHTIVEHSNPTPPRGTDPETAPRSAKAQLAELDAMKRVLHKGREFEPRVVSPVVYHAVQDNLSKGLDTAIELGGQAVIAEQQTYLADLALGLQSGTVSRERFAYETGRIAAEGIVLKRNADDKDVFPTAKDVTKYLRQTYPDKDLGWVSSCTWHAETIPLTKIDSTPPSGGIDEQTINAQVAAFKKDPQSVHPVVLVLPASAPFYVVADGHHRVSAAFTANLDAIQAWVGTPSNDDWQHAVVDMQADRMNVADTDVAKGGPIAAGLAVRAKDTGRVLMLRRATDGSNDEAAGTMEMPGGRIEGDESPRDAAMREWQEETGSVLPEGTHAGGWKSLNGVYQGFVYDVEHEFEMPAERATDPDGDTIEELSWLHPHSLPQTSALRPELREDLDRVMPALELRKVAGQRPSNCPPAWSWVREIASRWNGTNPPTEAPQAPPLDGLGARRADRRALHARGATRARSVARDQGRGRNGTRHLEVLTPLQDCPYRPSRCHRRAGQRPGRPLQRHLRPGDAEPHRRQHLRRRLPDRHPCCSECHRSGVGRVPLRARKRDRLGHLGAWQPPSRSESSHRAVWRSFWRRGGSPSRASPGRLWTGLGTSSRRDWRRASRRRPSTPTCGSSSTTR